jgi:cyclophilin family peptidyl-prolyl cis-trans isomerase
MCLLTVLTGLNTFAADTAKKEEAKPSLPVVEIKTSMGDIKVELYPEKAPVTVKNFLDYVAKKRYNGTIFHRVINGFMIQGGGFDENLDKKPTGNPIENEADNKLSNKRGTIAMARTHIVDSATNQFFINLKDNSFLDHKDTRNFGYCVFGKVIKGMDVVDKIAKVKTRRKKGYKDVPEEPVIIKEIIKIN